MPYDAGTIVEYRSFAASGWSPAEVIRYAPPEEQWLICPNCRQQAVPAESHGQGMHRCPRCQAIVRFPALPPLVYIRTVNPPRCKPFPVRESGLRLPVAA